MSPSSPFWQTIGHREQSLALISAEAGPTLTYALLQQHAWRAAEQFRGFGKSLIFIYPDFDTDGVTAYLGALLAGHAVHMCSNRISHPQSAALVHAFAPEWILWKSGVPSPELLADYLSMPTIAGHNVLARKRIADPPPDESLALLVSTSGSTGGGKLVRLSARALAAAAHQVATALGIAATDRAFLSLSYSYVYGLSVLNSHLHAGAAIVLERRTPADLSYWRRLQESAATSLPGVSLTYQLMRQLGVDQLPLPHLRSITHAGEPISPQTVSWLDEHYGLKGAAIFVMYGQTEACGRISVLPPGLFPKDARSAGYAVPDGLVTVNDGQIAYRGPNVMDGYATCRAHLCRGDEMGSQLSTGDLGYVDSRGLLYITGRIGRWSKIDGKRVSLADVEGYFRDICPVAAVDGGEYIALFFEGSDREMRTRLLQFSSEARLPPQSIQLRHMSALPRTGNGKLSYFELLRQL